MGVYAEGCEKEKLPTLGGTDCNTNFHVVDGHPWGTRNRFRELRKVRTGIGIIMLMGKHQLELRKRKP